MVWLKDFLKIRARGRAIATWFLVSCGIAGVPVYADLFHGLQFGIFSWSSELWATRDAWYWTIAAGATLLFDSRTRQTVVRSVRDLVGALAGFILILAGVEVTDVAGPGSCRVLWVCQLFGGILFAALIFTASYYLSAIPSADLIGDEDGD